MRHALSPALREFMNSALLDSTFVPTSAKVGRGGFDAATNQPKPAQGGLYTPADDLLVQFALAVENNEVTAHLTLPQADSPTEFSEVALFGQNGVCLMHATFAPQVLAAGVEATFEWVFLPEVNA